MNSDIHYMTTALRLAEQGRCTVSPNPMVGCIIVKDDRVVGQGFHVRAGEPHAEIFALKEAGVLTQDASAYVTLEPCCHYGKTPPCTSALIAAGIKKIYVATVDPNPLVAGKGIDLLRAAGIKVHLGLCEKEAKHLNEIFFHYITHKRPFVIAKWAMSLDGNTCVHAADQKQISSAASQQHTHQLRQQVDAILVGANTVCQDNPRLTARLVADKSLDPAVKPRDDGSIFRSSCEKTNSIKPRDDGRIGWEKTASVEPHGKHPIRIILSGRNHFPHDLNIFNHKLPGKTIIAVTEKNKSLFEAHINNPIELLFVQEDEHGQIYLPALLDALGKKQITSLLVEGGMTVHKSFFRENLVNKIHVYVAPVFIGSLEKKRYMNLLNTKQLGNDFHLEITTEEKSNV